ncbi:hypothetical protein ACFLX5_06415 [Chloroflexota bacterium]
MARLLQPIAAARLREEALLLIHGILQCLALIAYSHFAFLSLEKPFEGFSE